MLCAEKGPIEAARDLALLSFNLVHTHRLKQYRYTDTCTVNPALMRIIAFQTRHTRSTLLHASVLSASHHCICMGALVDHNVGQSESASHFGCPPISKFKGSELQFAHSSGQFDFIALSTVTSLNLAQVSL